MKMQHHIVYRDPLAYSCFPAIVRRQNGELWVSFRRAGGFSVEALRRGHYDHVDKGARIALTRSLDGGITWEAPRVLAAFDPECGEQDPSITELRGGVTPPVLTVNFFQWRVVPAAEKARLFYPTRQQYDGSWSDVEGPRVIRSYDGGVTWERPPAPVASAPLPRAGTSDAILELPGGELLMGIYGADPGSRVCRAYVVRSSDGGATWGQPALIARDPAGRVSFEEPALARLADGCLLAILRSGEPGDYRYLYQAVSRDRGQTWDDLQPTPMWGHPAHVLMLADGRLLCSYGYRRPPYGVRACASRDGGRTWDIEREIVLRDDGGSRDLGYPCSAELPDGTLVTVYYIHGEDGVRHIAATRWRLR
ncbi:MAG: sialidase family protein [Chloroflexi bacterium]|nr:sialidase family protein [Chloroflexota bacterium]